MALLTVEGVYRNGRVLLSERPQGIEHARVVVTFLEGDRSVEDLRRAGAEQMLEDMKRGVSFGGVKFDRDAVYEERMRELDARRSRSA